MEQRNLFTKTQADSVTEECEQETHKVSIGGEAEREREEGRVEGEEQEVIINAKHQNASVMIHVRHEMPKKLNHRTVLASLVSIQEYIASPLVCSWMQANFGYIVHFF